MLRNCKYILLILCLCSSGTMVHAIVGRVLFYNTENFFDAYPDSTIDDSEFTPDGLRHWHYGRYRDKLFKVGQVIANVGQWHKPMLVGLCEVENRKVLEHLVYYSPLKNMNYSLIHFESPYNRGLDVALLYDSTRFLPLNTHTIPIELQTNPGSYSRDILYVSAIILPSDTLHLYICHFPSRRGGEMQSEKNRHYAATCLRNSVDSIYIKHGKEAKILIMGDFNDYPSNRSLRELLMAKPYSSKVTIDNASLYNLSDSLHWRQDLGSYKYAGQWGMLDQFIVSGALLKSNGWQYKPNSVTIFAPEWLLTPDKKNMGVRPYSTYWGRKYQGGYSDHLPIYMDIQFIPNSD